MANNNTQSSKKWSYFNKKQIRTTENKSKLFGRTKKGTLPSKYGGNGAPGYELHEDVHHAPI